MFYINTRKQLPILSEIQIQKILKIPPDQRSRKDHQNVYFFFLGNEMLKELERTKSLNARIKCIACVKLFNQQDYTSKLHILLHVFDSMELAVLQVEKKDEAQKTDERWVRKKMDQLARFTLLNNFKYDQLLYLAQHTRKVNFKSQQYVYREHEQPAEIFFISKGEFHILKSEEQLARVGRGNKKGHKQKMVRLKSLQIQEQNIANKAKKKKSLQYKIGIIEGQIGQEVGLEEIVLDEYKQNRIYSIVCASAEGKAIVINKEHIEAIFEENPGYFSIVKKQVQQKNKTNLQNLSRIKTTHLNLPVYLKESDRKNPLPSFESYTNSNLDNFKLPFIEKKDTIVLDYRKKAFSSFLNASIQFEDHHLKSLKSQENLSNEENQQDRVQNQYAKNRKHVGMKQIRLSDQKSRSSINKTIDFPSIKNNESMDQSIAKSLSIGNYKKSHNGNHSKLIDSTALIKGKMDIMARKITNLTRQNLFPPHNIVHRKPILNQNHKLKKQKASPAHSNRFIQKMLLSALKKAGYDEAVPTEGKKNKNKIQYQNRPPHSSMSIPIKVNAKSKRKIGQQSQILTSSAFDQCYFSKF